MVTIGAVPVSACSAAPGRPLKKRNITASFAL
jgi:hypothetical protein